MISNWYSRLLSAGGFCFVVFLSCWWVRALYLVPLVLVVWMYRRVVCDFGRHINEAVERMTLWREILGLLGIVILGILARLAWLVVVVSGIVPTNLSDYAFIWQNAHEITNGSWPVSKSWVTALYYAGLIKIFDSIIFAYVGTIALQVFTGVLGWCIVRKCGGRFAGFCFIVMTMLSPNVIVFSAVTATENLYAFFIVVITGFVCKAIRHPSVLLSVPTGLIIWMATWSRAEGVMLWAAVFIPLIAHAIAGRFPWKTLICWILILVGMFGVGAIAALRINKATTNDVTIFCSNDNLVPRYMGSVVETGGRFNGAIYDEFNKDEGPCATMQVCAGNHELRQKWFKLLVRRTEQNWNALTFGQKIVFVFRKQMTDWWGFASLALANMRYSYEFFFAAFCSLILLVAGFSFLFARNLFDGGFLLMVLAGTICALSVGEAQPRYSYLMYWVLPFYAAMGLAMFCKNGVLKSRPVPSSPIMTALCGDRPFRSPINIGFSRGQTLSTLRQSTISILRKS